MRDISFHETTFCLPFQENYEEPGVVDVRPMSSIMDGGSLRSQRKRKHRHSKLALNSMLVHPKLERLESPPGAVSKASPVDKGAAATESVGSAGPTCFTTYLCEICRSTFSTVSGLRNHQAQHFTNPESGFFCETCTIKFNSQASLYRHKRLVHSAGGKRYIHNCEYCHKGYFNKTDLLEHLYNHTKIPAFTCELCDQRFRSKVTFRKHRKEKHGLTSPIRADSLPKAK